MAELNRRRFLQIAGAGAGYAALSQSVARAAALPAARTTGSIEDVEHIVVLMQENRSFDHYFGTLKGVRGFGDPRPVTLPSGEPVWYQALRNKETLPFHPDVEDLGMRFVAGLNHDWSGGHRAFADGRYDDWIAAKSERTMAYLERADMPFHFALADAFTVCDAYHCSFIGATDPNRYYMLTGYVGNDGTGGGPVLGNEELGYGWTTYAERLEAAGVSWKVYQDIGDGLDAAGHWGWIDDAFRGNYGDNSLLYFNSFRESRPGDALYEKARTGTDVKAGDGYFDVLRADVAAGRLPQISWIAAPEAFSEHPDFPVNYGAWYISQVLDALTSNPEVWAKTALFVTYDENDGYFDHVVPPYVPSSAAQGRSTVDTTADYFEGNASYAAGHYGMGQRVPMLVVSPWSTGGYVNSEVFDHTSIIRFMERRFGVHEPNISPWRRAVAGDLTSAFDFGRAQTTPAELPDTSGFEPPNHDEPPALLPKPPAKGALPRQERGSRPARPLPYEPFVDCAVNPDTGKISVTFGTGSGAGICFHIRSDNRTDGPWTYTAASGTTVSDAWNSAYSGGTHDLTVFGPNGFLRRFRSPGGSAGPEVRARHDRASGDLLLTLANPTSAAVTLTLTNAYGGVAESVTLAPGADVRHTVDLSATGRWYDVHIVSSADSTYLRRLAGHVETGAVGVSDPAIATV